MTDISNSQTELIEEAGIQVLWMAHPRILVAPTNSFGQYNIDPHQTQPGVDVTEFVRPETLYGNLWLTHQLCDPRSDQQYIENRLKAVGHEAAGLMWDLIEHLDRTYKRQFIENLQSAVEVALPQMWRGNA